MRSTLPALACTIFLYSVPAFAQVRDAIAPASAGSGLASELTSLTLPEALARAAIASPSLRGRQAQLAAAEGLDTEARALLSNNPQISFDKTRRQVPLPPTGTENRSEWSGGISQVFETGGQGRFRRETAAAGLEALRYEIAAEKRQVRSDVSSRFFRVLALQQRVELEAQALQLFDDAATAVQRRRRAGEDTKLDANVAMVEAERARNQMAQAREELAGARAELAARLQLVGPALPQARGDLSPLPLPYTVNDLLGNLDAQPAMLALAAREKRAQSKYQLERASGSPDITVGVNVGREGPGSAREKLTTLSVSIPLPLFKRNYAAIGEAVSQATQAQIDRETGLRDARANLYALWSRLASQEQRVRRLQESVLPALTENLRLSVKSRQAGQIGLLELIVVNRQALDARRDLIEALSEYHSTRAALELAAGWPNE